MNFAQGKNIIIIIKNNILKYNQKIHGEKTILKFDSNNNILINTKESKLYIEKNVIFVDDNELECLRRNIQLVRNPDIFNIENIANQIDKNKNEHLYNDEENLILLNRPFSYNIQNIFFNFLLNKIAYEKSDFMEKFKITDMYSEYDDTSKKYENSKGNRIVKNIKEIKNEPHSIENSFNIEYILYPLNVKTILDKLNEKEETSLKIIFEDYSRMKDELLNNNNESLYFLSEGNKKKSEKIKTKFENISGLQKLIQVCYKIQSVKISMYYQV